MPASAPPRQRALICAECAPIAIRTRGSTIRSSGSTKGANEASVSRASIDGVRRLANPPSGHAVRSPFRTAPDTLHQHTRSDNGRSAPGRQQVQQPLWPAAAADHSSVSAATPGEVALTPTSIALGKEARVRGAAICGSPAGAGRREAYGGYGDGQPESRFAEKSGTLITNANDAGHCNILKADLGRQEDERCVGADHVFRPGAIGRVTLCATLRSVRAVVSCRPRSQYACSGTGFTGRCALNRPEAAMLAPRARAQCGRRRRPRSSVPGMAHPASAFELHGARRRHERVRREDRVELPARDQLAAANDRVAVRQLGQSLAPRFEHPPYHARETICAGEEPPGGGAPRRVHPRRASCSEGEGRPAGGDERARLAGDRTDERELIRGKSSSCPPNCAAPAPQRAPGVPGLRRCPPASRAAARAPHRDPPRRWKQAAASPASRRR